MGVGKSWSSDLVVGKHATEVSACYECLVVIARSVGIFQTNFYIELRTEQGNVYFKCGKLLAIGTDNTHNSYN